MPRKKTTPAMQQKSLLDLLVEERETGGGIIKSMLQVRRTEDTWRGLIALPPQTLVEDIVAEFDRKSNIPLEIPFFCALHYLAGYMLHHGITIHAGNDNIKPDIWTVILADSGAGKTYTIKTLQHGIPELKDLSYNIAGIVSTAKFVEILAKHNNKLFFRDEFAEFYKSIQQPSGPMAATKDKMLQLYNNETIDWKTKKEEILVEDAAIVFLAVTVKAAITGELTAQDMINGFAQRFSFIIAPKDKKKDYLDYPIWEIDTNGWDTQWDELKKSIIHDEYIASEDAEKAFRVSFRLLANKELDESFYRRQLWKAHKYALLYHILLGRGNEQYIKADCYGWAARIVSMLVCDSIDLLKEHGLSDLQSKLEKVIALKERRAKRGLPITPRLLVQNINSIKTVSEAKALFELAFDLE